MFQDESMRDCSAYSTSSRRGDDLVDVDIGSSKKGKAMDDKSYQDEDDLSDSQEDDEASTIDMAEENEKKVRKSLLFAILSACGLLLCIQLIGRLLARCTSSGGDGADEIVAAGRESMAVTATNTTTTTSTTTASTTTTAATQAAT